MTQKFVCYSEAASGQHLFAPFAKAPRAKWNKLFVGSVVHGAEIKMALDAAKVFAARYAKREYGASWKVTGGSVDGIVERGEIYKFGVTNESLYTEFRIAVVSE